VSCHYALLDDEALLHLVGPDTLKFLQGQTTCDTETVDAEHATPGAYCTPKGRVVCDFLLCQIDQDHYALRLRSDILEHSAAVFGKYIVFSKAELQPSNTAWQVFGCWGESAREQLHTVLGLPADSGPGEQYACHSGEGFVLTQIDAQGYQFECFINTEKHRELAQGLAAALSPGAVNDWLALQIDNGFARVEAATVEEFIPQVLNYDLTGLVNFSKGCYTGQEVVARLHYRGKSKRRLFHATTSEKLALAAGAPLYSAESERVAGTVVNSALGPDGLPIALIVAPVAAGENVLHLGSPQGPALLFDLSADNTG